MTRLEHSPMLHYTLGGYGPDHNKNIPMLRMETVGAIVLAIEHYLKLKRVTRRHTDTTLVELNLVADAYRDNLKHRIHDALGYNSPEPMPRLRP